jgi:ubiquinone/menaquinone biosynthesis C-methylase UbiE
MDESRTEEVIKETVRQKYGSIARRYNEGPDPIPEESTRAGGCCGEPQPASVRVEQTGCCGEPGPAPREAEQASCCGPAQEACDCTGAAKFYSAEELASLPDSVADASLGCGNPIAIAEIQPGEVVLDLGSGGGIDCFLAARQVGPEGKVIGLDMTPEMIKLARSNAKRMGATNVDFRYGEMEDIPLPDGSVNAVISNCVINLSPDKDAVFSEVYRVLKPGGRMSVSDIVVDGQLPQAIRQSLDSWAGCIAGALDESDYLGKIEAAGFQEVEVLSRDYTEIDEADWEDVKVMVVGAGGEQDAQAMLAEAGLSPKEVARKVASIKVRALKKG